MPTIYRTSLKSGFCFPIAVVIAATLLAQLDWSIKCSHYCQYLMYFCKHDVLTVFTYFQGYVCSFLSFYNLFLYKSLF